jgi:CRISPR-associated endonuclease/helicase Cas3
MSYCEFFKSLTGFLPHPYQERLADQLREGRSVILRVPTGAGKTWAAVAPFLYSLRIGSPIGDRLLYALPLRSLATSLHATVCAGMVGVFDQVAQIGNDREYAGERRYCSLQIGSQKDDAFFESDVIFTTIDQLLSGYLFLPVSLPDRVGNINAGALIGSVIVVDEIHLLDSAVALGTVIEMLDRLRGLCQFVLMTATMSDQTMDWLAGRLGAVVLRVDDDEIRGLPSQRTKHRTWRWRNELVKAAGIKSEHSGGRTIVLLNTVQRAQDLFLETEGLYCDDPEKPELLLLHARFYPEDRKRVEDRLPEYFGPKATKSNVILVTTQVIEAGLDLSADHLHSELAPMNALVQRAGRTARYKERPTGTVTIYDVGNLAPYEDERPLVDCTCDALRSLPPQGREVDFVQERDWVRVIHADTEVRELKQYERPFTRRKAVGEAMDQGDRGLLKRLVRDIVSVGIAITDDPKALFQGPTWPRLLSISGFSLKRLGKQFQNLKPDQWVAQGATEDDSGDERPGLRLKWSVLSVDDLRAQWLVAIHPDFASYCTKLGLRLGIGGPAPIHSFAERAPADDYEYQFEPWATHSELTVKQARAMRSSYARAAEFLAQSCGVSGELVESLVELTCALHDTGKLSVDWQKAAWHWQDDKDKRARAAGRIVPARPRVPLAHTWLEPKVDRPFRYKREYRFPPHAVQSAFAVCNTMAEHLAELGGEVWATTAARCAMTAIARHHGTRTRECTLFRFEGDAARECAARAAAAERDFDLQACRSLVESGAFPDELLAFSRETDFDSWPLFVFLVRRLRLADQRATAGR